MAKSNFELNLPGLNELMKSSQMKDHLASAGRAVAEAAGGEYETGTYTLSFVAVQNIWPASRKAAHDNYENNTLLKALGAVGLQMK